MCCANQRMPNIRTGSAHGSVSYIGHPHHKGPTHTAVVLPHRWFHVPFLLAHRTVEPRKVLGQVSSCRARRSKYPISPAKKDI
jgi:hypothetical protein